MITITLTDLPKPPSIAIFHSCDVILATDNPPTLTGYRNKQLYCQCKPQRTKRAPTLPILIALAKLNQEHAPPIYGAPQTPQPTPKPTPIPDYTGK